LDIEQIGHVHEGLLDHTARRAVEIVLGLEGKEETEIALAELNRRRGQPGFVEWLADETGRSSRTIDKALEQTTVGRSVALARVGARGTLHMVGPSRR
jgi:hypothetical protein